MADYTAELKQIQRVAILCDRARDLMKYGIAPSWTNVLL